MAKDKSEITKYERTSVCTSLKEFCTFSIKRDHDYMEVTGWDNGEGFDVDIETAHSERFQLTYGQYEALKKLVKALNKDY
jgi:hypothetical protein